MRGRTFRVRIFSAVYKEAVELCAYLCNQYGLTEKNTICHCEGYKLGIAGNHGDVLHWFPKHGKSMDTFRGEVKVGLAAETPAPVTPTTPKKYYRFRLGAQLTYDAFVSTERPSK